MTYYVPTEEEIVVDAAAQGFWLVQRTLDNEQSVWAWLLDEDETPQPSFLTRRQALDYMSERLSPDEQ
jgi:hypothetical protein